MCKRCRDKLLLEEARTKAAKELKSKASTVKHSLLQLLSTDKIKGSNYVNLLHMTDSKDLENLVVVEELIKNI